MYICTVECTEPPGTSICILEDLRPVSKLIQIAMTKSGGWLSPGTGGHRVDDHQSTLSPNIPAHNYSDSSLFLWTGEWPAFSAGDKICTLSLLTIDTLLTVEKAELSWESTSPKRILPPTLLRIFLYKEDPTQHYPENLPLLRVSYHPLSWESASSERILPPTLLRIFLY